MISSSAQIVASSVGLRPWSDYSKESLMSKYWTYHGAALMEVVSNGETDDYAFLNWLADSVLAYAEGR